MATARQMDNSYHMENGIRIYNDKEAERRNDMLVATARPLKSEAEILKENRLIRDEAERRNDTSTKFAKFTNHGSSSPLQASSSVKNADQPFSVYLANRALDADYAAGLKQNTGQSVSMTQTPNSNTYTDDGILIEHILNDLRKNVFSSGVEYDTTRLRASSKRDILVLRQI